MCLILDFTTCYHTLAINKGKMLSTSDEITKAVDTLKDDIEFPFEASRKLLVTHGVSGSRVPLSSLWTNENNSNTVMVVFGRNLL